MSLRMPERHSMGNIFFRLRRTESIRLIRRPAGCWPRSPLQAVAAIRGSRGRKAHCGSGSIVAGKSIKSIPRQVRFSAQSSPTGSSLASPGSMESCGTPPGKVSRVTYVESIRGPGKSWSGWRCRRASTFLGSSPTDAISFSAEEDPPERSGQSVGLGELRERAETLNRRLKVRFLPRSPSSQSFTDEITRKSVDLRQGYLHDFPVSLCHLIGHHIPVMFMVVLMSACRMSFCRTANRVPTASRQERYVWRTPTAMGKCCNGSMSGIAGYIRVKEKSGSVQESVARRDFAGVLILPKSGYTRQHARDRLDQGVRVAWVSGVPTRNQ